MLNGLFGNRIGFGDNNLLLNPFEFRLASIQIDICKFIGLYTFGSPVRFSRWYVCYFMTIYLLLFASDLTTISLENGNICFMQYVIAMKAFVCFRFYSFSIFGLENQSHLMQRAIFHECISILPFWQTNKSTATSDMQIAKIQILWICYYMWTSTFW